MSSIPPRYWAALPQESLLWETWDEGAVLFNRESGQTHYLNPIAELAIRVLQQQSCTASALCRLLANELEAEATPSFQGQIDDLMTRLDRLGLVTHTTKPPSTTP